MSWLDNTFLNSYARNKALRDQEEEGSDNWYGYNANMYSSLGDAAITGLQGAAGILGTSMQMATPPDISTYNNEINQLGMFRDGKTWDINQLMANREAAMRPINYTYEDIGGISNKAITGGTVAAGLTGAATGFQIGGPWGALIGGVLGTGAGLLGGLTGKRKAEQQVKALNSLADYQAGLNEIYFNNQADKIQDYQYGKLFANRAAEGGGIHIKKANRGKFTEAAKRHHMSVQEFAKHVLASDKYSATMRKRANFARNAAKWHAEGGQIETISDMTKFNTHGGYYAPDNLVRINTGGTHEENPNGGVQFGMDNQGIPNLVEENENIYNDYVFSDRLKASKAELKRFKLPEKYEGLSFTAIADKLSEEARQRPNDAVSNNGMGAMLDRLMACQEEHKQKIEEARMRRELNKMSPEELLALGAEMGQAQPAPMMQQEMPMQQMQPTMEAPMMPQEQAPMEQAPLLAAYGGPVHTYRHGSRLLKAVRGGYDASVLANPDQPTWKKVVNGVADAADIVGMTEIPIVDQVANAVGALGHAVTGDWVGAGLSAASAIPLFGKAADVAKAGVKGVRAGSRAAKLGTKAAEETAEAATKVATKTNRFGKSAEEAAKMADTKYGKQIETLTKEAAEARKKAGAAKGTATRSYNAAKKQGEAVTDEVKRKVDALDIKAETLTKDAEKLTDKAKKLEGKRAAYQARLEGKNLDSKAKQAFMYATHPSYVFRNADALSNTIANTGKIGEFIAPGVPGVLGTMEMMPIAGAGLGVLRGTVDDYKDTGNKKVSTENEALIEQAFKANGGKIARTYDWPGWLNKNPLKYIFNREKDITGTVGIAQQGAIGNGTRTPFVYYTPGAVPMQVYGNASVPPVFSTYSLTGEMEGPSMQDGTYYTSYTSQPAATAGTGTGSGKKKTAVSTRRTVEALPKVTAPLSPGLVAANNGYGYILPVPGSTSSAGIIKGTPKGGIVIPAGSVDATPASETSPKAKDAYEYGALATWPRYAGVVGNIGLALANAFQEPDRLDLDPVKPTFVNGLLALERQRYNPLDQQSLVNPVLANSSAGYRAINDSGLGASTGAAMIAAMNAGNQGIGNAMVQGRLYNDQLGANVIQQHNNAAQTEADFYRGLNTTNAQIANQAAMQNYYGNMRQQMYNNQQETAKWAAVSQALDASLTDLSNIGRENCIANQVNSNRALLGDWVDDNGIAHYRTKDGQEITGSPEEIQKLIGKQSTTTAAPVPTTATLPNYYVPSPVFGPVNLEKQKQIQAETNARIQALRKKHGL